MKHRSKRLLSILLSLTLALSLVPALGTTALAADNVSTYTLQIPSTLNVANSGWNTTSGLTASVTSGDTFASGKKLSVTAASTNSWALKSGDNSVSYKLATASADTEATTAWSFTAAELNSGTTKTMGIIVEDYSTKPAGTYTDTVTFTAKVENAVTTRIVTWNASDITDTYGESFTKDGITITAEMIDDHDKNFSGPGTFTTASGKFTKIVVSARNTVSGTGWTGSSTEMTWEGDASSSVSFSGNILGMISVGYSLTIVFTIEE